MSRAVHCALCAHVLKPGINYNCPGGDDTCMEGTCPNCKTGFTLCIDGCVVRESNNELRLKIVQLEKLLDKVEGITAGAKPGTLANDAHVVLRNRDRT